MVRESLKVPLKFLHILLVGKTVLGSTSTKMVLQKRLKTTRTVSYLSDLKNEENYFK